MECTFEDEGVLVLEDPGDELGEVVHVASLGESGVDGVHSLVLLEVVVDAVAQFVH